MTDELAYDRDAALAVIAAHSGMRGALLPLLHALQDTIGYVPDAIVTHDYAAIIDRHFLSRHTLWHARGMARFVRKHPERLLAL